MSKPRQNRTLLSALGLAATLCAWSAPALAEPGDGVTTEDFKISLFADLAGGVNTNLYFLASSEDTSEGISPVGRFTLTPHFQLATRNPKLADLSLDLSVGLNVMAGGYDTAFDQSGLSSTLAGAVTFNPLGAFRFHIDETFTRTNEAPNQPSAQSFNRIINRVGATASIVPGDGVLQGHLSYHNNIALHNILPTADYMRHDMLGRFVWQFFPRTAALLTVDWRILQYFSESRGALNSDVGLGADVAPNVNSKPLRITGGLNGLITNGLSLRIVGGYGWGFYESGANFSGVLIDTQLSYNYGLSRRNSVSLGYARDFNDSILGSYTTSHRFSLGLKQKFGERLSIGLQGAVSLRQLVFPISGGQVGTDGGAVVVLPSQLDDVPITLNASADYTFTKWFMLGVQYNLMMNLTDSNVAVAAGGDALGGREYVQNIFMVRARFTY